MLVLNEMMCILKGLFFWQKSPFCTFFPLLTSPVSPLGRFLIPGSAFPLAGSSPLRRSRVTSSCSSCTCFCSSTTSPPVSIPESFDMDRLRRGPEVVPGVEAVLSKSSKMESWRITAACGGVADKSEKRDKNRHRDLECFPVTCRSCSCRLRLTNRWRTSCDDRCYLPQIHLYFGGGRYCQTRTTVW